MKLEMWPNGLGAIVHSGRLTIEVWEHGGCRRLVPDNSACGYYGTHYTRVPVGPMPEMATAAVESWRNRQNEWSECEPH